jgi:hypothetical protein
MMYVAYSLRLLRMVPGSRDTRNMAADALSHHASQTIEFLAFKARGYGGKLQGPEVQRFKAALVRWPERWTPDKAPLRAFELRCLGAGLSDEATSKLSGLLRRAQKGDRMRVTSRFDRASPVDVPDDWTPPGRNDD